MPQPLVAGWNSAQLAQLLPGLAPTAFLASATYLRATACGLVAGSGFRAWAEAVADNGYKDLVLQ